MKSLSLRLAVLCCFGSSCARTEPPPEALIAAPDAARDRAAPAGGETPVDAGGVGARTDRARGLAHNVIVFMGDGMGPEQLSTGRFAKNGRLRVDALAGPAFAVTDSLSTLRAADPELVPTDSAAAASVIATGVLVENGVLSLGERGEPLETVLELCKKAGKATGLVTTSYFFDASPAAFAAHQPSRAEGVPIIRQMLRDAQPDVIMGAGMWLLDVPESGLREHSEAAGYTVIRTASELTEWDPAADPRLLGLFATDFVPLTLAVEPYSMTPALERRADSPDPTLATMTARALDRLALDPDGFFLFAEDEILDEIGHRGPAEVAWANRAYPQQVAALDDAIAVALDWVLAHSSFDDTLLVVLADHETGGYRYDHELGPASGDFFAFSQDIAFRIGNHTRAPTAVYALGPGSDDLAEIHSHSDTHRLLIGAGLPAAH